jgi:geranylgeranyl diphosphate synthase type I
MDAPGATVEAAALEALRRQVDEELVTFLERIRAELAAEHPDASVLVDELLRLIGAGGKRFRPALCYWGHRAAGGPDGRAIVVAAASLELLHSFAVVHDDVMDRSPTRRGVAATHARFAGAAPVTEGGARYGDAIAILVGDLAAVLARRMFDGSGFPSERSARARERYERMCLEMAVGQFLDLSASVADEGLAIRINELKTGSYTIEGPLLIGASLAGGPEEVGAVLAAFARPLGEAFQLRDDLLAVLDGERDLLQGRPTWILARARERLPDEQIAEMARSGPERSAAILADAGVLREATDRLNARVDEAVEAIEAGRLDPSASAALVSIARLVSVDPNTTAGRRTGVDR